MACVFVNVQVRECLDISQCKMLYRLDYTGFHYCGYGSLYCVNQNNILNIGQGIQKLHDSLYFLQSLYKSWWLCSWKRSLSRLPLVLSCNCTHLFIVRFSIRRVLPIILSLIVYPLQRRRHIENTTGKSGLHNVVHKSVNYIFWRTLSSLAACFKIWRTVYDK
jgi:hypothetical protein